MAYMYLTGRTFEDEDQDFFDEDWDEAYEIALTVYEENLGD